MSGRSRQWTDALVAAGAVPRLLRGRPHLVLGARRARSTGRPTRATAPAIVDHHRVPYRDFAVDYPPGALPVFILPAYFDDYAGAFEWVMAACGVALVGVLAFVRREAAYYAALAPLLVGSLILSRFDLWPALLLVAALAALLCGSRRHRLGVPRRCDRGEAVAARRRASRAGLVGTPRARAKCRRRVLRSRRPLSFRSR